MKTFIVTLGFVGLTGEYRSQVEVVARNEASAKTKALRTVGNRDCLGVMSVRPAMGPTDVAPSHFSARDMYPVES